MTSIKNGALSRMYFRRELDNRKISLPKSSGLVPAQRHVQLRKLKLNGKGAPKRALLIGRLLAGFEESALLRMRGYLDSTRKKFRYIFQRSDHEIRDCVLLLHHVAEKSRQMPH